jgi:hypothetical protein
MYSTSTLKRRCDGKLFKVMHLGHWSTVQAHDGESDTVKQLDGDEYVGMCGKNNTYVVIDNPPTSF